MYSSWVHCILSYFNKPFLYAYYLRDTRDRGSSLLLRVCTRKGLKIICHVVVMINLFSWIKWCSKTALLSIVVLISLMMTSLCMHSLSCMYILPGPLARTVIDFWRLIWEECVEIVIMLTKITEEGAIRCQQYWPSSGMANYGPFRVVFQSQSQENGFLSRKFVLTVSAKLCRIPATWDAKYLLGTI